MKKLLLPTVLIVSVAVGVFFYMYDPGEQPGTDEVVEGKDSTQSEQVVNQTSPEEEKEELERQLLMNEHARPYDFVILNYDHRRNLLGESIIEGSLTNNAELTTYKDFQIMIYFEDTEGMVLDSASQMVFETLKPGAKKDFKLKDKGPRKAEVRVRIVDADVK